MQICSESCDWSDHKFARQALKTAYDYRANVHLEEIGPVSAASFNTDRMPTCDELVSAMLSGHPLGQPVSTRRMLLEFRKAAPARMDSDDEIVGSVVRVATGRTMAVAFDHRAAEQPPLSWSRPDASA